MIEGFGLTWWDENGENSIDLQPYQLWAIHQILGLQINPTNDGGYEVRYFNEETVKKRVQKAGILADPK